MTTTSAPDISYLPVCGLRHFYGFLRHIPSKDLHESIACALLVEKSKGDYLAKLFETSLAELGHFTNLDEDFHPDRGNKRPWRQAMDGSPPSNFAERLPYDMQQRGPVKVSGSELIFEAIDYEVPTLRSTKGAGWISPPTCNPGRGGIDVLLACNGRPSVGEIKAEKDTTMLMALVQSLTYAAELSTTAQQRRLRSVYPDRFDAGLEGVAIAIFYQGDTTPDLLQESKQIAEKLMNSESTAIENIESISFVEACLHDDGRLHELKLESSYGH